MWIRIRNTDFFQDEDDSHVVLIQTVLDKAMRKDGLVNEVFLQLIKQTTDHPEPNSRVNLRHWSLLALACSIILPVDKMVSVYCLTPAFDCTLVVYHCKDRVLLFPPVKRDCVRISVVDLDPTGPYSATLWIWIQLGSLFSHFVDLDPTWARIQPLCEYGSNLGPYSATLWIWIQLVLIQPLCGYGSNLGPYSATLWIWIQLGSLFSHFEDLDPTWVLIQPILVTALPCHKTLPFTPSK